MLYRGFYIFRSELTVMERWNPATVKTDHRIGVSCEVYDKNDQQLVDCLDAFPLTLDHELPDLEQESIEAAIRNYVDEHYTRLDLMRNEVLVERRNQLMGLLIRRLSIEVENEAELYDILTEHIGMTDEEIRACGCRSLVPYFNRRAYAQTIAEHMIHVGSEYTITGNWHFGFDTIKERFGIDLEQDEDMVRLIEEALYEEGEVLSQIDIFDNDFDLMFYLDYCPLVDDEQEENANCIRKEDDMAMKNQKVTAELPTPRYRALHYYLEKAGKTIEQELRRHLEQMYCEQVPKDVQEYVKSQHPELEGAEQGGAAIKRQHVGQRKNAVVLNPMEQELV